MQRTVEILRAHAGMWMIVAVHRGDQRVRCEPFAAVELDLSLLWADLPAPPPRGSRAAESGDEYVID